MLTSLNISGYALIDTLEVEFGPGLNIITGETGAGKSILIGALKMILGSRASSDVIRTGARKAVIEGHFVVEETSAVRELLADYANDDLSQLILRREISPGGSRAFVNDYPVPVSVLKGIASEIIDLHGQHDQQSLLRRETHLMLLDLYGRHQKQVDEYSECLAAVSDLTRQIETLQIRQKELGERAELHGFQLNEIDEVEPAVEEEDTLDRERRVLENAERLRATASTAYDLLYGSAKSIYDKLAETIRSLEDASRLDPKLGQLSGELDSASISIDEVAKELLNYVEDVQSDNNRLATVMQRLGQFEALKRKYGGSIASVLSYRNDIAMRLTETADLDGTIEQLEANLIQTRIRLSKIASALSAARQATARDVEKKIVAEMNTLGMVQSKFSIQFDLETDPEGWIELDRAGVISRYRAWADGVDRVEFLLSTNPGEPVRSLRKVASGGEISRIMLAMKQILAQRDSLPILVFDEIDVGISGAIAQRVGERMSALAQRHQLITITHLPQIAACADYHHLVEKQLVGISGDMASADTRTRTNIRTLSLEERAAQVAALISGAEVTDAGLTSARELLEANRN